MILGKQVEWHWRLGSSAPTRPPTHSSPPSERCEIIRIVRAARTKVDQVRTDLVLALDAIRNHPLRAFLTVLGLTAGVAALMAVITLIQGANTFVAEKFANMGTNVFQIAKRPFATTDFQELFRARRHPDLGVEDLRALRESCELCDMVGASVSTNVAVRYGNQELRDVSLRGNTPDMASMGSRVVDRGRYFTEAEERHSAAVCLIGSSLVQQLFPTVDPVGRIVRVGRAPIHVIGTFEEIGSVLGSDQDNYLVTPLSTFFRMRGSRHSLTLEVKAAGEGLLFEQAQDQARALMRARRGIKGAQREDFYLGTSASYIELWETISSSFFIVFISISSIAAVVGGIVIMNIMLVSVTERTKEIGVRRACGARRGDILRQFLAESMMQCIVGGSFGVLVGFAVALLLRRFASFPADVQWWVAVLGVGLASAVGLFFGIYPAMKAADLDPVEALRAE